IIDSNINQHIFETIEQCLDNLSNTSCLLTIIQTICEKNLFPYLPIFVTNDWIHMIRYVQDLEKMDTSSSPSLSGTIAVTDLQEKIAGLNENLSSLHELLVVVKNLSTLVAVESSND
ncbi:unnamed protein product, partial [Rotaria magnacalcarata]